MTRTQQRTLAFCNRVRVALGKKPRKTLAKGAISDSTTCPIARTIYEYGISAASDRLCTKFNTDRMLLSAAGFDVTAQGFVYYPQYAREFIDRFDRGKYPELIA